MADQRGSEVLQAAKAVVLEFYDALDAATGADLTLVLEKFTTRDHHWRGMHPFYEQLGAQAVAEAFWKPFRHSFSSVQRRPDVFLAGYNDVDGGSTVWVCQMGHLMGLFDESWLDIPPTNRIGFLPYAEFHRLEGDLIAETALFVDVISVMRQAGHYPLPPQTGASFVHPGPRTHDGLLIDPQDTDASASTLALVNAMIADLEAANQQAGASGDDRVHPEFLEKSWHDDMVWMGPDGIGATYTIDRYQQQHQYPFRFNLTDKRFNGHVARFAEGDYAAFFGWANLTNRATGGLMGLPASIEADMRVVDVYRRSGDKLAENWIFIDILHWLSVQGLDVLQRMRQLIGIEEF